MGHRARALMRWSREARPRIRRQLTPPQLFVGSFALLICLGTLGLRFLPGLYVGERLGWVDALFTATSAVCVTGLIVVDTATYFTVWGQSFLLLLIQLGGLGMITFTTLIILALGRRLSLRQERITTMTAEVAPSVQFESLTRDVVLFTFLIEAVGALILYALWVPSFGWVGAVWPAVFHAISAFCNAGFSTFSDSLIGFRTAPGVLLAVIGLIVLGGLGFLTLEELRLWRRARRAAASFRLSLHSQLALWATLALILIGWGGFALFEWRFAFADLPLVDRLVNALFASITARTAGFNTFSYQSATDSTNFLSIILMFIGGSPGSTAGGIKTTTLALLVVLAWSRFRGRDIVSAWHRSVPEETVQRAVGLAASVFAVVTLSIFIYTFTERTGGAYPSEQHTFLTYMFEAVSAFNTVGLSIGATADLSTAGRLLTTALMFVGRVGPLTFAAALALAARRQKLSYHYAYEDVIVG
jgi:trk system potassium uptake protein TrkH